MNRAKTSISGHFLKLWNEFEYWRSFITIATKKVLLGKYVNKFYVFLIDDIR